MTATAEIVSFRLAPGTSREVFLAALAPTYPVLARWPGHVQRRLIEGEDGSWTEFLEWDSREAALAAAEGFMADPTARALMALIDPASVVMRHEPIVMAAG